MVQRTHVIVYRRSRIEQGLLQVLFFQVRVIQQNFCAVRLRGEQFQHPPHRDAHPPDTGLAPALPRLHGDALKPGLLCHNLQFTRLLE